MRVLKLLFLLVLISCDSNAELFSIESIRDFSASSKEKDIDNEITDILMVDLKEYVFVKVDKSQKVAKISLEELQIIYEKYYKKENDYTSFLYEVLNFKKFIPIQYFSNHKKIYQLNNSLMNQYKNMGIKGIKKMYTTEKEKGKFYINSTIDTNYIITIQYIFYINKYEHYSDDYIPLQWFVKTSDFKLYKK